MEKTLKADTLGSLIDRLEAIREEKRLLAEKEKEVNARFKDLEAMVLERLDKEGMEKATGRKASVSRSHTVVGTLQDWEALTKFIKRTGNFQLFQRRISDPAFRELLESKGSVPGVEAFTKVTLNLRSL